MIENNLITSNQASSLKKLGYPQDLYYGIWYYPDSDLINPIPFCGVPLTKDYIVSPTLDQASKWLRDTHKIILRPIYVRFYKGWDCLIVKNFDTTTNTTGVSGYPSYEDAQSAALDKVLKELTTEINSQ